MTYGFDDCTFTAIGTSTTETRLNTDSPLRVPSSAKTIFRNNSLSDAIRCIYCGSKFNDQF